jgi:hypothetical protein
MMIMAQAWQTRGCGQFPQRRFAADKLTAMSKWKRAFVELVRREDGDVPGWVLITLMTAGLVIIIWAIAGPALSSVFEQAIDRVVGF